MKVVHSIKKILLKPFSWFKKTSWKKKTLAIVVLIIVISIIASQIQSKNPTYNTEPVKRADIVESVDESGIIKISGQTDIYSPTNGIVEEIYVTNGQQVTKGQELFKVQSTATEQEQQAAYANYLTAQTALNAAKSNLNVLQADMFGKWDTFKELAESDDYENGDGTPKYEQRGLPEFHIPEKEWLAAEQKFKDQQQVIAQGQAAVNSTWIEYQATQNAVVKSTADGTVANLSVVIHDSVSVPSATNTSAQPILTVADYSVIGVLLSLGESDINKIKQGDKAEVNVDAIDHKTYNAVVSLVNEIARNEAGIMKYQVFLQIMNSDNLLKSGMSADAEIVTNKKTNVLSVPNTAVKPYQGGKGVQIVNAKKELEFIPVQTGIRGDQRTEITKGLTEGQEIVVSLTNDQVKTSGLFGSQ